MLSFGFSRWLSRSGFERRAVTMSPDRVVYRLADGSGHVALRPVEWEALGARFAAESGAVTRRLNWGLGCAPFAILAFALAFAPAIPGSGLLILVAIFLGPPAAYLWQSRRIERIAAAIEAELARLPRVAPPPEIAPHPVPRWLEIVGFLLIGPGLIIQVYGSLNPDAYRNTPLSGTHLNAFGIAGFIALAAIIYLRRRARQPGEEPAGPDDEPAGRRTDFVARARQSGYADQQAP